MDETEVGRMIVRLQGDGSSYMSMMKQSINSTSSTARAIQQSSQIIQRFTGGIQSYASQASRSLLNLKNTMVGIATMGLGNVGGGMVPGLVGLAGLGGAIAGGGWAISLANQAEQAAISFEVMLGSAAAGKKMLDEIIDFAAKTPFEMPGLRSAAQMMLNFGVAQDRVMPTLKALGDVAAGDQNKLNGLAYAYSQTQAAGRLMGQDLMQMINWGFNPLQEISRKTGKSMGQLKDEMSKGGISAKMVEDAFISASSAGGKFFNMMEKQSTTIGGLQSTLADTIKIEVTKIGTTLVDKLNLKGFMQAAIKQTEVIAPAISNAFVVGIEWAKPKVIAAYKALTAIVNFVAPVFIKLKDGAVYAFVEIGKTVGRIFDLIGPKIQTGASKAASAINSLSPVFNAVIGGIKLAFDTALPFVETSVSTVVTWLYRMRDSLFQINFSAIPVKDIIYRVAESVRYWIFVAKEWVSNNQDFLVNLASVAGGILAIKLAIAGIASVLGILGSLAGMFIAILNPVTLTVAAITGLTYLLTKYTDVGKSFAASMVSGFKWVGEQFGLLVELFKAGDLTGVWKLTVSNFKLVWIEGITYLKTTWFYMQNAVGSVWLNLMKKIELNFQMMTAKLYTHLNSIIDAFNKVLPKSLHVPRFDTKAAGQAMLDTAKFYREAKNELDAETERKVTQANQPLIEERANWAKAQEEIKKGLKQRQELNAKMEAQRAKEEETLTFGRKVKFNQTFLGAGLSLAKAGYEKVQSIMEANQNPVVDKAKEMGQQVGSAYGGAVKASMQGAGSIEAVKVGSLAAYNRIEAYKAQLAVTNKTEPVAPNAAGKKEDTNLLTDIAEGTKALVDQGRQKASQVYEFIFANLGSS